MSRLFLTYAAADAEEAAPIAQALARSGWHVDQGPLLEVLGGGKSEAEVTWRAAACTVVAWSSNVTDTSRIAEQAHQAELTGKLVVVRLDHATHPFATTCTIDWMGGHDMSDEEMRQSLRNAVRTIAGDPPAEDVAEATKRIAGEHKGARRGAGPLVIGALAVLALLAAGAAMLVMNERSDDGFATGDASLIDVETPSGETPIGAPGDGERTAILQWKMTARDDANDIRAFLEAHGASLAAADARATLNRLDRSAWAQVEAAGGAIERLGAIQSYLGAFPEGVFARDARARETQDIKDVSESQVLLARLDIPAGQNGQIDETTADAYRKFQISSGLPVTADLDAASLAALRSTLVSSEVPDADDATADAPRAGDTIAPSPEIRRGAAARDGLTPRRIEAFRDCFICPQMVMVPPGQFVMGDTTGAGDRDEQPTRNVRIAYALAVSRHEISFEEWDACINDGGCSYRPDDNGWGRGKRPVSNISFSDARAYLSWLSHKTGQAYRLLSEAEWEYVARAGSQRDYSFGDDLALLCQVANGADADSSYRWRNVQCADGHGERTAPVASYEANAFGLHDVHGNVWEWVEDCWHGSYAGAPTRGEAWTTNCDKSERVLRGGAFSVDAAKMRSAYRYSFEDVRMPFFGLRVARRMD